MEGIKFDQGKEPMDLISPVALFEMAKVLAIGAAKYTDKQNWRNGMAWTRVYAAVQRHLNKWHAGETMDQESGFNHLAHAMVGIMFLLEYAQTFPEKDDRFIIKPKSGS